jgi:hypothetical protein
MACDRPETRSIATALFSTRVRFVIEVRIRQKGQTRGVRPELHNVEFAVDAVSLGYGAEEIGEIA